MADDVTQAPAQPVVPTAPQTTAAPVLNQTPPHPAVDHDTMRQLEELRRTDAAKSVELEAARRVATEAQARAAQAEAQRNDTLVTSTLQVLASRAHNPKHVVQLLRERFDVADGKVVVKGSQQTPEAFLAEWFAGEGKYHLSPMVPPGAGGPAVAAAPAQPEVPKVDLNSASGMTSYVRQRTQESAAARFGARPPAAASGTPKA